MDTGDQFKQAEDQYNRLKEQLEAGSITQGQFDAAVKRLTVQDAQGHTWVMGDNGYWVMRETTVSASAQEPRVQSPPTSPPMGSGTRLPVRPAVLVALLAAGLVGLLCLLGLAGVVFASNTFLRTAPQPVANATLLQAPTLPAQPSPVVLETPIPTNPPASPTLKLPDFAATTAAPTVITPTATIPQPTSAPTPTIAPGLYVTGVRVDPPAPARRQEIRFIPVFLNTTNATANLRWKVLIFKPDNLKNSLGETSQTASEIPVGQGEPKASGTWRLGGSGACDEFIARVSSVDDKNRVVSVLNKPDGTLFEHKFTVCG